MTPTTGVGKDDERLPGRWARSFRTALLTSKVGGRYLGGRMFDAFRPGARRVAATSTRHAEAATDLVRTMRELRGPLLKMGQLLSTHTAMLPAEYSEWLTPLQENAPPMSYDTIRRVVVEDLGCEPREAFAEFSEEAVAAASLGQVHRGRLADGTDVAIKIQYPGAHAAVDGDMRNLETGAVVVKRVLADLTGQSRLDITPFAAEIAEHLRQETDYCREAYNAKLLARVFANSEDVRVPRVHDSHSGLRVITYDWLEGLPLSDELEHPSEDRRRDLSLRLLRLFWHQLTQGGVMHADPHPGNFRVLPDGRIGLLDHGCVKVFDESFVRSFRKLVCARMDQDDAQLREAMSELNLLDDPDSDTEIAEIGRICDYCAAGLSSPGPFDFGRFDYVGEARSLFTYFLSRRRLPPAQRDFLFLSRVTLGYYEYLTKAGLSIDLRRLVEPYVRGPFLGRTVPVAAYES